MAWMLDRGAAGELNREKSEMTRAKFGICVLLLAALCLPGFWVLAGDDEDRPNSENLTTARDADPDDLRSGDGRDDEDSDDSPKTGDDAADAIVFLGKTVKLTFTIVGEEEEPSFIVLCAAREFHISREERGPEFEHSLNISGELRPVDAEDRIFLSFEAKTHHHDLNEDFEGVFNTEGSAIVTIGKKVTLANLGDEPLTVTATVEE